MSRRNPGAASAMGLRVARERWRQRLEVPGRDRGRVGVACGPRMTGRPCALGSPAYPQESMDAGHETRRSSGLLEDGGAGRDPDPPSRSRRPIPSALSAGAVWATPDSTRVDSPGTAGTERRRSPRRVRVRTGVRAAALLGVLAVVLGGCFWWQAGTGDAQVVPLNESAPAAEERHPVRRHRPLSAPAGDPASAGPGSITVHVAGAVARPGVVQLPAGSRVHEAITAAGGATDMAEPDRLNLAASAGGWPEGPGAGPRPTRSGRRRRRERTCRPVPPGGTSPGSGGGKINLNTAGVEELGTLPRVGPVLAQRIVDWRQQHGRFKTVQELDAVDGIGPKLLEALLPLVGV